MGEVVRAVSEATHNGAILVTDVGQNQMMSARYFKYSKERSIVTSGGLGTMGFGLPAAIGATFGRPDRTVCVFMGDGGLQMNLQELGTIMEQKAPVKMILLNNNFLGNVRQWQAMFFNRRYSFTPMMNPDYMKIASAYDIPARRVMTREELAKAITDEIRRGNRIDTTTKLREIIEKTLDFLPEKEKKETVKKTCQRVFQALRIDVNQEFEVLYEFMEKLPNALRPGGRAAILTFHSGEDKLVKAALKEGYRAGIYKEYSKDVVRPSAQECVQNPRARSTKMRWAIRADE